MLRNTLGRARFPELAGGKINLWTKVYVISYVEYFYRVPKDLIETTHYATTPTELSIAFAAYRFYSLSLWFAFQLFFTRRNALCLIEG